MLTAKRQGKHPFVVKTSIISVGNEKAYTGLNAE